jgi:hypothetical protein
MHSAFALVALFALTTVAQQNYTIDITKVNDQTRGMRDILPTVSDERGAVSIHGMSRETRKR